MVYLLATLHQQRPPPPPVIFNLSLYEIREALMQQADKAAARQQLGIRLSQPTKNEIRGKEKDGEREIGSYNTRKESYFTSLIVK